MFVDDLKSFQKAKSESLTSPKTIKKEADGLESAPVDTGQPESAPVVKEEVAVKEELTVVKPAKRSGTDSAPNTPTKIQPSKSKRRKR